MKRSLEYLFTTDYHTHRQNMQSLWKRVYGHENENWFDSFYANNPLGTPFLALCYDGDQLVGEENYLLQNVAYLGVIYRGAMGVDTLIDPDYRVFYGIFGKLCQLTIDELSKRSDLLFANPNEESKKYYLKYFNWKNIANPCVYKKVTKTSGLNLKSALSLIRPGRRFKELDLEQVSSFESEDIAVLTEHYRLTSKHAYFHKSREFLNWKFLRNTHYKTKGYLIQFNKKPCGYCVTYDTDCEKKILDILIEDDEQTVFCKTVLTLSHMAKEEGMERLVIHATEDAWYKPLLRRMLFVKRNQIDFIAQFLSSNLPQSGWIAHCGDFDIF